MEDRPYKERGESRSACGAGRGSCRHVERDDHGGLLSRCAQCELEPQLVQKPRVGLGPATPIPSYPVVSPVSVLCRLAGERHELQVRGELALETRCTTPTDRPSRLLVHEVLAAARAGALLEFLWIGLH